MVICNDAHRLSWRAPLVSETFLFIVGVIVAAFFSSSLQLSLTFSVSFLPAILLFYVIAVGVFDVGPIRRLYASMSIVALALSCRALWAAYILPNATPTDWIEALPTPILVVPNDLIFLSLIAPFSLALCAERGSRWMKMIGCASLLMSLLAIVVFQSRSALLTFLIGVGFMGILYRPRLAAIGILLVSLTAVLLDGLFGFPLASKFTQFSDRLSLWIAALSMFSEHPIFGYGPHTFGLHYETHLDRMNLPSWIPPNVDFTPWPHNLFLEVGAEHGVLGLGLMVLLISRCYWVLWDASRAGDKDFQILVLACAGSLVAFCAASMIELTFLRIWVVIILFLLVGIIASLGRISDT